MDGIQLGGVVPVMAMVWKSWQMTLYNASGIYFSSTPGMLSRQGALWLGSRRRASWKIAGVRLPMTMFFARGGVLVLHCAVGIALAG
jgi:hypothetical protein